MFNYFRRKIDIYNFNFESVNIHDYDDDMDTLLNIIKHYLKKEKKENLYPVVEDFCRHFTLVEFSQLDELVAYAEAMFEGNYTDIADWGKKAFKISKGHAKYWNFELWAQDQIAAGKIIWTEKNNVFQADMYELRPVDIDKDDE